MNRDKQIEEICPCQTDIQACCSCVSMHCDECHKPMQSKFVQGRYCSNCGRPLKAELKREYRKASEVAREIFAESLDHSTLSDWYISSVNDSEPMWTDAHIEELLNDFYVIPKEIEDGYKM